jgi:protease I
MPFRQSLFPEQTAKEPDMATVAVIAASGFEAEDVTQIFKTLATAGHRVVLVSPKKHEVRGWRHGQWNGDLPVDVAAVDARGGDYDAVVLPGGVLSADTLRADQAVVEMVIEAADQGIPVAAMGHAAWVLVEAGLARGREATSHPAIRRDLENAGASWRDEPAVDSDGVITGRHGHDLPAFLERLADALEREFREI